MVGFCDQDRAIVLICEDGTLYKYGLRRTPAPRHFFKCLPEIDAIINAPPAEKKTRKRKRVD